MAQKPKVDPHVGRLGYLQALVTEFQETESQDAKEQVLANLANFAYDPSNYQYLRQLQVLDLFLDSLSEENETLVEFAIGVTRVDITALFIASQTPALWPLIGLRSVCRSVCTNNVHPRSSPLGVRMQGRGLSSCGSRFRAQALGMGAGGLASDVSLDSYLWRGPE
ncbi:armadillo repeat-containing protein 7 isoform X2 [Vicugna pacos]|uniref:Armadillo repeat-containing protein 7 isoform X2 n=1 Tax=Vicugna pacos TaxID=30538 RepID=A0ABM5BGX7_VICPA